MLKRVKINKEQGELSIEILGSQEPWMLKAILLWTLLWLSIGLLIIIYLIAGWFNAEQQRFFIVFLAFWSFFAWKSVQSLLYQWKGIEYVTFKEGRLNYTRDAVAYKRQQSVPVQDISSVRVVEKNRTSFAQAYNASFWVVGNEQIQLELASKQLALGIHLQQADARRLQEVLARAIKHQKQKESK